MSLKLRWENNRFGFFTDKRPACLACRFFVVLILAGVYFGGCSTTPLSSTKGTSPPPRVFPGYSEPSKTVKKAKPYKVGKKWYYPMMHAQDFRQQGIASWYGKKFHGRKTSSGETYNMYAMTAAHKTLPLGTHVRVRHLQNGKTIDVKINDRGPFVRGRIIDLSYTAAKNIGIIGAGTGPVEIVALGKAVGSKEKSPGTAAYVPIDYSKGNFTIQIGAFTDRNNAVRLQKKLDDMYQNVHITEFQSGSETLHRVRVGRCSSLEKAEEYEQILIKSGFADAMIVAE